MAKAAKTEAMIPHNVRVGFMSRIDYGSPGFRYNLVKSARKVFEDDGTLFDILAGGLVSKRHITNRIKEALEFKKTELGKDYNRDVAEEEIIEAIADELSELIPKRIAKNENGYIKLYIMVSPEFDGDYGYRIAERLAIKREDIKFWAGTAEVYPFKPPPHPTITEIACLVPPRGAAIGKSEFYSNPVDRVVRAYVNIAKATKKPADIIVVGCYGSSINKPKGGESGQYIFSLLNLNRMEEEKESPENQIGVKVLEFTTDGEIFDHTHNFNDLVVNERKSIKIPETFSAEENELLNLFFHKRTSWTEGYAAADLGKPRKEAEKLFKSIMHKSRNQPFLAKDEKAGRYFIVPEWIQRNLDYPYPWPDESIKRDSMVVFGCMHALCAFTDHIYFVNEIPKVMLKHNVDMLVGVGDFIEGRNHGLPEKLEVVAGATYTQQEKFAAWMVGEAIIRVFEARFKKAIEEKGMPQDFDASLQMINNALPTFLYIPGNHDEWTERFAVKALTTFRSELKEGLHRAVSEVIGGDKFPLPLELIENKIVLSKGYKLPSGINVSLAHFHMGGSKTKSQMGQKLLGFEGGQVNLLANFHTAISAHHFEHGPGQRVVMQVGTMKHRSSFEDGHGKKVDFGFGFLVIESKDNRIIKTTTSYFGNDAEMDFREFDNDAILVAFAKSIGVRHKLTP